MQLTDCSETVAQNYFYHNINNLGKPKTTENLGEQNSFREKYSRNYSKSNSSSNLFRAA